jgi:hypothetical protein
MQTLARKRDIDNLADMCMHIESQILLCRWSIFGWWKGSSAKDSGVTVPKGHLYDVVKTGEQQIQKFTVEQNEGTALWYYDFLTVL